MDHSSPLRDKKDALINLIKMRGLFESEHYKAEIDRQIARVNREIEELEQLKKGF